MKIIAVIIDPAQVLTVCVRPPQHPEGPSLPMVCLSPATVRLLPRLSVRRGLRSWPHGACALAIRSNGKL